jgi:hypothetical protein
MNHGKHSLISDLRERAVCKFDVENEVDVDPQIMYENVKCINEAFGDCEQLVTTHSGQREKPDHHGRMRVRHQDSVV